MSKQRVSDEAEREARRKLQEAGQLEQAIAVGVGGPPQLRRTERRAYLGQFPEQVLAVAAKQELDGKQVPDQLRAALSDARCKHVYLDADVLSKADPILRLIRERDLPYTIVHSPEYRGDAAVVLTTE
ncbi:MAG: DUF1694 domain-containing protein [Bacillota bacterium]|jgi:uncharacterized protein YueI